MLNYALIKECESRLLKLSNLTEKLYLSAGSFYAAVCEYVDDFRRFAEENRLYLSSDLAVWLDKLTTYRGEARTVEGTSRGNVRKEKDAYAATVLQEVHTAVKQFISKDRTSCEECEDIWRQVCARLGFKKPKLGITEGKCTSDDALAYIRADSELLPYYTHVLGVAGSVNAKVCLDNAITQLISK